VEAALTETDDRVTTAAVLARVGRPKKGKQDNSRKRESLGESQTRDYTLARLRRDDPEMAARIEQDRPSASKANALPTRPCSMCMAEAPRRRGNAGALQLLMVSNGKTGTTSVIHTRTTAAIRSPRVQRFQSSRT
jgi:hypothetical protein